ncbi:hypothetical protein DBR47_00765 [Paucibacter sp. KBW04]|uniref:hypothetical protein n=1 Tax=Paucibacter sp. KBW04 TaxID=2153361 RepID=UPI000F58A75D|nr:hypothetical protein [Paucibacter sp. KBW04]RQO63137.1 hypothetical protein DBR47_00765 [Paucibacter sp. KBW04]
MIATLMEQVRAAFKARPPQPTRVGLLNTGELVVLDASGGTLVFAAQTTRLIREAIVDCELVLDLDKVGAGCND